VALLVVFWISVRVHRQVSERSPENEPFLHQLSPSSWQSWVTGREVWVRAGVSVRLHRLSSATCQFIKHVQHAFRHDTIRSVLVHRSTITSLLIRVSAALVPRSN